MPSALNKRSPFGLFLIRSLTSNAGEQSVTFFSIPQTFRHLCIRFVASVVGAADNIQIQFNGDAVSTNYSDTRLLDNATTSTAGPDGNGFVIIALSAGNSGTNTSSAGEILIPFYTSTTWPKHAVSKHSNSLGTATAPTNETYSGLWRPTLNTPVTQIVLRAAASAFKAGSAFDLYGEGVTVGRFAPPA